MAQVPRIPANVAGNCRKFKKLANSKKSATIWINRNLSKGVLQEGAGRTNSLLNSLSKLLRYTLASNDVLVPLSREVYIVNEYFALHHARFGDRMQLHWSISPDINLAEIMVPSFILQPLVDNSFKHGIGPKEEGGSVEIRIWAEEDTLYVHIIDDGVGMTDGVLRDVQKNLYNRVPTEGEHIGAYNIAARLRLYGERFGMDLLRREGGGTIAVLRVPLKIQQENEEEEQDDEYTHCR